MDDLELQRDMELQLAGDVVYDVTRNRAVAVDVRGMLEAMRTLYGAGALVDEMTAAGRKATP